jgi:protein-disulfide isomerase
LRALRAISPPHSTETEKDYIEKGKVNIEFREFPLDPWAAAAALVGRCVGGKSSKRFFAILDILFQKQEQWVNTEKRMEALQKLAQTAGISQKKFRGCFDNKKLLEGLNQNRLRGEQAGVRATPSFIINGILVEGNQPYSKLREIIDGEL